MLPCNRAEAVTPINGMVLFISYFLTSGLFFSLSEKVTQGFEFFNEILSQKNLMIPTPKMHAQTRTPIDMRRNLRVFIVCTGLVFTLTLQLIIMHSDIITPKVVAVN